MFKNNFIGKSAVKNNEFYFRYALFFFGSMIFGSIFIIVNDFLVLLASLILYSLFLVSINPNSSILSPIIWFIPFNLIYSISYPIYLYLFDLNDQHLATLMLVAFISSFAFCLVNMESDKCRIIGRIDDELVNTCIPLIYIISGLIIMLIIYSVSIGLTSKREFLNAVPNNPLLSMIILVYPLTLCYVYYFISKVRNSNKVFTDKVTLLVVLVMFGVFAVIGERDALLRILMIVFFVFCYLRFAKSRYTLFYVLTFALFLLPMTQFMKGFFVTGASLSGASEVALAEVFFGEFASSSRNIHTLLLYGFDFDYGRSIITDILRSIPIIGSDFQSTTQWYNDVYRTKNNIGGTSGWGFSLAGQGLITGGYFGVAIIFILLGLITRAISNLSSKSTLYLTFYLVFISITIYVIRADFANLFSQGIKNPILGIVMMLFLKKMYSILHVRN